MKQISVHSLRSLFLCGELQSNKPWINEYRFLLLLLLLYVILLLFHLYMYIFCLFHFSCKLYQFAAGLVGWSMAAQLTKRAHIAATTAVTIHKYSHSCFMYWNGSRLCPKKKSRQVNNGMYIVHCTIVHNTYLYAFSIQRVRSGKDLAIEERETEQKMR